jgi:hypothetical protein
MIELSPHRRSVPLSPVPPPPPPPQNRTHPPPLPFLPFNCPYLPASPFLPILSLPFFLSRPLLPRGLSPLVFSFHPALSLAALPPPPLCECGRTLVLVLVLVLALRSPVCAVECGRVTSKRSLPRPRYGQSSPLSPTPPSPRPPRTRPATALRPARTDTRAKVYTFCDYSRCAPLR